MGRAPCCSKVGLRRGPWTQKEDTALIKYIQVHGEGNWRSLPKKAGLLRCGKSCRLRWKNYLRPDIKRGNFTPDEDDLILRFHSLLGNRWSLIAGRLPGRTDNEIKNYWNSHLSKTTTLKNNTRDPLIKKAPKCATTQPKNQEKNKHNATNKDITTNYTKVHYPKPVRVSSTLPIITNSCFNNEVSDHGEGDDDDEDEGDINNAQVSSLSPSWFDLSDGGEVMVFDENHDVVNYGDIASFDLSCQYHSPREDNMIENLYEEYQELLKADDYVQLDSFVESLLV